MADLSLTHTFPNGPASLAYVHEGERTSETGITLPLLQSELMFRLEGDFSIQLDTAALDNPNVVFMGMFTQPMTATVAGRFSVAGVFFQPYGFYQLTGQSIQAYGNHAVDAQMIWGDAIQSLRAQLLLVSPPLRLNLLQEFMARQPRHDLHPRVKTALDWLNQAEGGQDLVYRLAKTLKVSEKTAHTDFKREIGLSPVVYQLLRRFQQSLGPLRQSDLNLTAIAHELDYYDQAHFIKRFSAFAQMTPGDYRKAMQDIADQQGTHYFRTR